MKAFTASTVAPTIYFVGLSASGPDLTSEGLERKTASNHYARVISVFSPGHEGLADEVSSHTLEVYQSRGCLGRKGK